MGNVDINDGNKRPKWKKSFDFLFAVVGMSVGLGNIWRFPYLCFKNGGGAFLIPYFIFAVSLGIPIVLLEISIGQRVRRGITRSWAMVPLFKGIAYAQSVVVFHSNVSYPIILAWTVKYLVNSFSSTLPWSTCNNTWNTADCVSTANVANDFALNRSLIKNVTSTNRVILANLTHNASKATVSSATEYWLKGVLNVSSGVENPGRFRLDLVLYLAILWIGIFLCTFKGVKWTAKIVYVTATMPFLLIAIILIRGVTLDGASDGIRYYLIPKMHRLADPQVWVSAGTQVLYSYATGCGALATLGSYNDYHQDFLRDTIWVAAMNSIASFASGFAVFSTLGAMALLQNTTVDKVASSGPGLAFIAYPEALSLLPLPQLWCALFFITILFLGFDSQFVCQESIMSFVFDNFPKLRKQRTLCHVIFCSLFGVIGLSMVTEGGVYVFEMYNNYAFTGWCMFFIDGCECVGIAWVYGFDRYWEDIISMIGNRNGKLWFKILWKYVTPVLCGIVFVYYVAINKPLTYQNYQYPGWAQFLSHLLSFSSVCWIPGYAIYKIFCVCKNGRDFFSELRWEKQPETNKVDVLLEVIGT